MNSIPMSDDFYCEQVLSGITAVEIVLETEEALAYHHTRPFWQVHVVVIPKTHIPSLTDLGGVSEQILCRLIQVVRQVAVMIETEHGRCRVLTNLGEYQESKHLHFHVVSGESFASEEIG